VGAGYSSKGLPPPWLMMMMMRRGERENQYRRNTWGVE
jgi:hypothetical protein